MLWLVSTPLFASFSYFLSFLLCFFFFWCMGVKTFEYIKSNTTNTKYFTIFLQTADVT